jgi:hypothetical protein
MAINVKFSGQNQYRHSGVRRNPEVRATPLDTGFAAPAKLEYKACKARRYDEFHGFGCGGAA